MLRAPLFLRRLALLAALAGGSAPLLPGAETPSPPPAQADPLVDFDLPAQPASEALLAFSRQSQTEVLFSFSALRSARSTAVSGRLAPEEALHRLLQGTGFKAHRQSQRKFTVAPTPRPSASIKGRILDPDGTPLPGARVLLLATGETTLTDARGEFLLSSVPPGHHELIAQADGFQATPLSTPAVPADGPLVLPPLNLRRADDPTLLNPFLVRDRPTRRDPFDRSEAQHGPRLAGSNLDLARSENDALPYFVLNRDQIARSGVVNLNEFLQRELLDADAATQPPEQEMMDPASLAGSTNLNLRGFGTDQTIILVNGRRLPEAVANGAKSQMPDVNFIPVSLVQQVEVLPLSAASLYSGNAVGGIINIVLRPGADTRASELTLTYTNALARYDAAQMSASLLHSHSLLGGALRLRFNASLSRATPPTESELRYRQHRPLPDLTQATSVYRATPNIRSLALLPSEPDPTDPPPTPPPLFPTGDATLTSVAPGADGTGGLAAFRGREGLRNTAFLDPPGGFAASYDSVDFPYGRRQTRSAFFASALYDITPWFQLGLDGIYTHLVQHRGHDVIAADLRLRAESPFNPFHREANVSLNEIPVLLGENHSEARMEFAAAVLSALCKLPRDWRALLDLQYGRHLTRYRGIAGADYGRWQEMVDAGRYNPLRDTQLFGPPPEFYDRVLIHRGHAGHFVTLGRYSTLDAALRLTHHALPLPTGPGTVNLGVDYRRNDLAPHNDERLFADGSPASEPTRYAGRALERYSLFSEARAPLLPRAWLPSFIRSAEGDLALRYLGANSSKETSLAPTLALKLQFPAGLAFRGSVSTSSRFPTPQMSRLFVAGAPARGVAAIDLRPAYDPLQRQTYAVQQEEILNPELDPESVLTQTAGLLWRAGHDHRWRASLDFVNTRKVNELVFLDTQTVLNLEHLFPTRVLRATDSSTPGVRPGSVISVATGLINSALRRSDNWNASLDYAWTRCFGGTLEAYGRLLYYTRYDRLLLPRARVVDELSHPEGGSLNILRYRAKFGASWSRPAGGFGADAHYYHSRVIPQVEWPAIGRDRIRPFWQFDAFAHADLGRLLRRPPGSFRAQLRVNNVFAHPYPRYAHAASGAGVQAYGDWRGRVYSLSLTTAF